MPSDYLDYDNLAFDPTANSGLHRSYTDRTQSTIELIEKIEQLTKQLEIAKKGLAFIVAQSYGKDMWDCAKGTLEQIKELEK